MEKSTMGFWKVCAVIFTTSFLLLGESLLSVRPLAAQAQAVTASLSGIVYDSSGATVPEATVTLSDAERGLVRTFVTAANGRYFFGLVPAGSYSLKVEKLGFSTSLQERIVLGLGAAETLDATLQVGVATQAVMVTSVAPLLNTADTNIETDVTQKQTVDLPLNLRQPFSLVFLNSSANNSGQAQGLNAGGQESSTDDQDIAFFNFGGSMFGATAFLLDGHWDTAADWGGIVYSPTVDEVQEMKIQTNTFTAQYGWSMGNVLNAITKSGTSSFHGDAFEFLRNSELDANYFFNNAYGIPKPVFRRNQFGFTAGGPLYIPGLYEHRNKTFIFGSFDGMRQANPVTAVVTVPPMQFRTGDFSSLLGAQVGTDALGRPSYAGEIYNPFTTRSVTAGQVDPTTGLVASQSGLIRDPFAGNIIPTALFDPVAAKVLSYWPDPTNSALSNNLVYSGTVPASSDAYTVRVDHNISEKSRLYVRWSQKHQMLTLGNESLGLGNPASSYMYHPDNRLDSVLDYNHVFSPTLTMDINIGASRWVEAGTPPAYHFNPSTLGLPSFMDTLGTPAGAFPQISVDDYVQLNQWGGNAEYPRDNKTYSVDVRKVWGQHMMSMGFMGVDLQYKSLITPYGTFHFPRVMTEGPVPTGTEVGTGDPFASFLLGTGDSGGYTINAFSALDKKFMGWYFQDDWKATRKLTLNLGIRYDFQTPQTDRFDRQSWFDPSAINPIGKAIGETVLGSLVFAGPDTRRGLYRAQYNNFAPRVGLAYNLMKNTVVRAAFGTFYAPAYQLGADLDGFSQTTPYVGTINGFNPVNPLSNPFPSGPLLPIGKQDGALTYVGLGLGGAMPFRPTPYVEQWTVGVQQAIGSSSRLEVNYIGNHGVKLNFGGVQIDQLNPQYLSQGASLLAQVPNPFYGAITSSGCGLDQATVESGQLLLPFPQYCGVTSEQALGSSSYYDAFTATFTHQWSQGLQILASFTVSKFLDNSGGPEGWSSAAGNQIRNNYNLSAEKALDINDIPKALVLSYIYEFPVGHLKHFGSTWSGPVNSVLGGWQVSGVTTLKDGFPVAITDPNNNTFSFGGGQQPNLVGDPHVSHPTINQWFNTAAFAQPADFTFGNTTRTLPNTRVPGFNNWDLSIQKRWNWKEKLKVEFRCEFYNAFNHTNLYAPDGGFGDPTFGEITNAFRPRDIQLGLKTYW